MVYKTGIKTKVITVANRIPKANETTIGIITFAGNDCSNMVGNTPKNVFLINLFFS